MLALFSCIKEIFISIIILIIKILDKISPRYFIAVKVSGLSVYFLLVSCFILFPVSLFLKRVPFSEWLISTKIFFMASSSMALTAIILSFLFCHLLYSPLHKYFSAFVFGSLTPLVLLGNISLMTYLSCGRILLRSNTPEGMAILILILLLFGGLGFGFYLSAVKEIYR